MNIQIEQAFLSCLMVSEDLTLLSKTGIESSDFAIREHQLIFEAISQLVSSSYRPNLILLSDILRGEIEQCDSLLARISSIEYCDVQTLAYSEKLKEAAYRKALKEAAKKLLDNPCREIYQELTKIAESCGGINKYAKIYDVIIESLFLLERKMEGNFMQIETGFYDLDALLQMQPENLTILAARPGVGKSALATCITRNHSKKGGVAFFSLEMSKDEIGFRLMSQESRVNIKRLINSKNKDELNRLVTDSSRLQKLKLFVGDESSYKVSDMLRDVNSFEEREKIKIELIIVDYLQLVTPVSRGESREQQVASIARDLKELARTKKCSVLALSQLNRGGENRAEKRPVLSDLRESGELEQAADNVIFLYKDITVGDTSSIIEAIIAKQRAGQTGFIKLRWFPEYTLFENLSRI